MAGRGAAAALAYPSNATEDAERKSFEREEAFRTVCVELLCSHWLEMKPCVLSLVLGIVSLFVK